MLQVPGTNFSVCVVIAEGDTDFDIPVFDFPNDFIYHRLDLDDQGTGLCNDFGRLSTNGIYLLLSV